MHAGLAPDRRLIEGLERPAYARRGADCRQQHAGHHEVDAEDRAAIDLGRDIDLGKRAAHELQFALRLEARILGRRESRRSAGQLTEGELPSTCCMDYAALLDAKKSRRPGWVALTMGIVLCKRATTAACRQSGSFVRSDMKPGRR